MQTHMSCDVNQGYNTGKLNIASMTQHKPSLLNHFKIQKLLLLQHLCPTSHFCILKNMVRKTVT